MSSHHRRASSVVSIGSRPGSSMDDRPKLALSHILVHRCEFKMPKNQNYKCPRNGEMFDPLFAVWYCLIHDRDAQRRCQAFSDYQGIRCPELGERVDDETGRKYCVKHFKDKNSHVEMPGEKKMEVVARAQTPVTKKFERKKTGKETPVTRDRTTRRMSDTGVPAARTVDAKKAKRLSVPYIPPVKRAETPTTRRVRDTPTPTRTRTPMHRKRLSEPTPKPVSKPISPPQPPKPMLKPKRKPRISNLAASISHKTPPSESQICPTPIAPPSPLVVPLDTASSISPPPTRSITPPAPASPIPTSPARASPIPTPPISKSPELNHWASIALPPSPSPPPPNEDDFITSPLSRSPDHWTPKTNSPLPPLVTALPSRRNILTGSASPPSNRWTPTASSPLPSPLQFPIEEDVLQKARARLSSFRSHTPTTPVSPSQECWTSKGSSPLPSPALLHSPLPSPVEDDVLSKARARLSSFRTHTPTAPASPFLDRWGSTSSPSPNRWTSSNSSPFHSPLPSPSPFEEDPLKKARSRLSSQYPLPSPTPPPLPPSPYEPQAQRATRPRPSPLQFPSLSPTPPAPDVSPRKVPARLPAFQFPASPSSPAPRSPSTPMLSTLDTPRVHHHSLRSISHVLSRFLHTTENREEEDRQRIAAMYQECNICHESHNAITMRKIEECGHQYRELCLQKVLRNGTNRRYNCSSCRAWMGKMVEERGPGG
ncbi:hypothetical protein K505DRAFT_330153 [Melanomma pulvis-pyrius CBS 109.77]|uniref:RING-type domain-containing protein n=1 Tax=Melanomma pulvis-pyrius CBS 109.77 TaxID=1314802 RepID=A0A6A6WS40_9PLEO|nr:hypothetical protein K505DRAFT_330153 [Melanomma pulvis-pyrius CBS 109.77]